MTDSRAKGRRGESDFIALLGDYDHEVLADTTAGKSTCDIISLDKDGTVWAWEVKNRATWDWSAFRKQAKQNATGRTRWALALHVPNSRQWLIERQGQPCALWRAK